MVTQIELGGISIDVTKKDIKNIHLSVHPPTGRVRISAPLRMNLDTIRLFAISKIGWIKSQQKKLRQQERETPREYLDRESHYVWGKRYLLKVAEKDEPPSVQMRQNVLVINVRPGSNSKSRKDVVSEWYRQLLKRALKPLIEKWEVRLSVEVKGVSIRKMKTKWGSCNPRAKTIRLNTELAKKPVECLEYIVLHEVLHLLESTHNARFKSLLERHMPDWRLRRNTLNDLPVRHDTWNYRLDR